jgi:ElaA protein
MDTLQWYVVPWHDLTLNDLYDLLQLRQEVFIKEQNCPFVDADGKDQDAIHLWARNGSGLMVACSRIGGPGYYFQEASIGRIVTHPQSRKSGIGKQLVTRSIEALYAHYGKQPIQIGAQLYLLRFYGSFGFVPLGDVYLEDGIEHVHMLMP